MIVSVSVDKLNYIKCEHIRHLQLPSYYSAHVLENDIQEAVVPLRYQCDR